MTALIPPEWRSKELERDTIALLIRNQKSLRQKATEIIGEFQGLREQEPLFIEGPNGGSTHV
jgi:hypothetical protein